MCNCAVNWCAKLCFLHLFLLTVSRAYATMLRPSVDVVCLSVTYVAYTVGKQCVLGQKVLLAAYRKSYMRNPLIPK